MSQPTAPGVRKIFAVDGVDEIEMSHDIETLRESEPHVRLRRFQKNCVLFTIAPRRSISYRPLRQENIGETLERRSPG